MRQAERRIFLIRVLLQENRQYRDLQIPSGREILPPLNAVREKDYFIITTNVDHCFQKAGVDKKRLFYTQGAYGLFQCSGPCCQETFDNESMIRQMMEQQKDMCIPSELLPVCPHCGRPMTMNLRADDKFAEDEGWHRAAECYEDFLRTRGQQRILREKTIHADSLKKSPALPGQFSFDKNYRKHQIRMQESSTHDQTSIWEYKYISAMWERC